MKRGLLFLCLLVTVGARAADDTEKLLDAAGVNELRFTFNSADPKNLTINWTDDTTRRRGVLVDKDTFASSGGVQLVYGDFNPFLISVTSTQATRKDPVQEAIDKAAADLLALAKLVVPDPTPPKGGGDPNLRASMKCVEKALAVRDATLARGQAALANEQLTADQKAQRQQKLTADAAAVLDDVLSACAACEALSVKVTDINRDLRLVEAPQFDKTTLRKWINGATGLTGIHNTADEVEKTWEAVKGNRDKAVHAKDAAEQLVKEFPAAETALMKAAATLRANGIEPLTCSAATPAAQDTVRDQIRQLNTIIAQNDALLESLSKLLAALRVYEKQPWRNDHDFVFDTAVTDPATIKTPTVTFKATTYSFDKNTNTITSKVDAETARTFDVRRLRRLVTEYGIAGVYNDLKYPKYSVKDEGSNKIVTQEFDTSNVNIAATLNFLCGSCIGSGVYPGFQIGLSKAKDYPGLLAGGVLRFGGVTRLAIASGVMVTWYKDLNKLTVGGPVESEDKLKNDLKLRHSSGAWYLAVQYSFP